MADSPETVGTVAVRLLQGYLWHPAIPALDLGAYLPRRLGGVDLLWDRVPAPFAFFENGELTASQVFYQFTLLRVYQARPDAGQLGSDARQASEELGPLLEATPPGVGWQLWEDLRDL